MQGQQPQALLNYVPGRAAGLEYAPLEQATSERKIEFESLLARELPRFQRMAMRWLRNREDAEDVVQDAVLSAFTHIASFQGRARMSSWLMAIVLNSARMQLRRNRRNLLAFDRVLERESMAEVEILRDPRPNPEQSCQYSELCGILADSINQLSETQRVALELYSLKGLSLKEAAKVLGIPVGTLKAQLARGRVRLSRKMWKLAATSVRRSPRVGSYESEPSARLSRVVAHGDNSPSCPQKPVWSSNRGRRGSSSVPA